MFTPFTGRKQQGYKIMTQPFSKTLAQTVQHHRKLTGLNQHDLAKLAGVGKTVIFDIEHEKETVKLNTVLKVLKVLNIQIELQSPLGDS